MKSKKALIAAFALLLVAQLLAAADGLTLEQATEYALQSSLLAQNAQLGVQEAKRTEQINDGLPGLSLTAGVNASGNLIESPSFSAGASLGIGVSFSFLDGDEYSKSARTLSVSSAQLSLDETELSVKQNTITLYWNLTAQRLNVQSLQSALDQAVAAYQSEKAKYDSGLADQLTLKQSELAQYTAEQNLEEAVLSEKTAQDNLESYIGSEAYGDLDSLLELKKIRSIDDFKAGIASSTTVKQAELNVKSSQLSYDSALHSATSPTLSVSTSVGINGNYSTSSNLRATDSISASVSLSIPTEKWFRNSSVSVNLDNLQKEIQQAKNSKELAISDAENEIETCYENIESCLRKSSSLEKAQTLKQETLELTQSAYDQGNETYLNLQNAVESVYQGKIAILQNQLDYTVGICTLALKLGMDADELYL